jgi:hypothetical protein
MNNLKKRNGEGSLGVGSSRGWATAESWEQSELGRVVAGFGERHDFRLEPGKCPHPNSMHTNKYES